MSLFFYKTICLDLAVCTDCQIYKNAPGQVATFWRVSDPIDSKH